MLKNYLVVAWRNLIRNPLHSSINVFGLAIGAAACLVIFTLIRFEESFNQNHPESERIYRIYSEFTGGFSSSNRGVPGPLPNYVRDNFTGIDLVANFQTFAAKVEVLLPDGSKKDMEQQDNLAVAVSQYFDLVGQYKWLAGTQSSMELPGKVVLTASQAIKYFGEQPFDNVLGRQLIYRDSLFLEVGGVVADIPGNSDFEFTDFISFPTIRSTWLKERFPEDNWGSTNSSSQLFVRLAQGTPIDNLIPQLEKATERYLEENPEADWVSHYRAQPLADLHYNTNLGVFDQVSHVADRDVLNQLTLVALAILLIAAINFVNLETAIATKRAKEVGIRKVLGSSRKRLVIQFLSQSFIVTFLAILLAIPLVQASLAVFSEFIPKGVVFDLTSNATVGLLLTAFAVIGLSAGLYPALVLSSFTPQQSLKAQGSTRGPNSLSSNLRKGLTVFQFGFSQILMILTLVVGYQIHFMTTKDPGFSVASVAYFYTPYYEDESKQDALFNLLSARTDIDELAIFSSPPAQRGYSSSVTKFYNDDGEEVMLSAHQKGGDTTYIDFFRIPLAAGRNLREAKSTKEALINETYARELGFTDPFEVLNRQLFRGSDTLVIVGVVNDFHFRSLHHPIEPVMITNRSSRGFGLRFSPDVDPAETMREVEAAYKEIYPDRTFSHYYMDETIEQFYESEKRASKLAITATAIAIVISCLGLFGLASFTTIQRTKEIGIRKTMGATVEGIVLLLSQNFLRLVLTAFVVAGPLAYWLGTEWLADFAYKLELSVWIFLLPGLGSLIIAFATVSYHSLRVSRTNPATSLRYE